MEKNKYNKEQKRVGYWEYSTYYGIYSIIYFVV